MDDDQKCALDRAVRRLGNAVNNIDRTLVEELPMDGDPEQVSQRVNARRRALSTFHIVLTSELDSLSSTWESVMQSALAVEEDQVRRTLISEYQAHWAISGGVEAEDTIHELTLLVGAALQLLPQEYVATTASTPLRPKTYTGSRRIPSFAQCVAPTLREIPPQTRGRHLESERTSEELAQPSTDSPKSENIGPSNLPTTELLSHNLQEQLVRLPKFDLPMFTGDIAKFGEFWDVFDSAVHSNRLIPSTVKFHYLRSSLRDDALALVAGYDITEASYELAVNTLHETYLRPTFMRVQMSRRLQDHPKASSSAISQCITLARIKFIWLQLKKLGEQDSNVFVMRIIRNKFPSRTLEYVGHLEAKMPLLGECPNSSMLWILPLRYSRQLRILPHVGTQSFIHWHYDQPLDLLQGNPYVVRLAEDERADLYRALVEASLVAMDDVYFVVQHSIAPIIAMLG
ncbi:hypothetical protein GCK32_010516 [Trichostrongylus colubriformis]|uniref:Uncharacterized protein n=1 Tax=Trichostrongylus colubriformis TaxID=6319 RepID=A0AAN8FG50_TRICO